MADGSTESQAMAFYYYGFYSALKRFRATAALGWVIAAVGLVAFLFGWDFARPGGLIELTLCICSVSGGLLVVHVAVTGLSAYVSISFPRPLPGETANGELFETLHALMVEVAEGGWREAFEALGEIEAAGRREGLPFPGGNVGVGSMPRAPLTNSHT
jgi:hypothetical protein